ncbi:hypothetical protein KAR91_41065 [Candidatus Pacearchaeota archaeon]|nr:hypothetical protein [Candidatus Pacearchaeota archaeon]
MKRCSKCGEKKSFSEFNKKSTAKDNLDSWCKKCTAECHKKYYQAHKIKVGERIKKYQKTKRGKQVRNKASKKYRCTLAGHLCRCFLSMKDRCNNPNNSRYKDWGGRGIRCLFKLFSDFFNYVVNDLGYNTFEKLKGLQIDRINNDEHYKKGNIRFVTAKENCNNRRKRA